MIGAQLGNWRIEKELASGTQSVVYSAHDVSNVSRLAVVKVLTSERSREAAFLQRFAGEMLSLRRLDHPNIARFYDSGVHAGLPWYAMEWVIGKDLASRLSSGALPWAEVLSYAVQAARALRHGHSRKLLHRDLKPAHFFVTSSGQLKLLDYGVARIIPSPPPGLTPHFGSTAYLPPEAVGGKPLTRRSEFYSLGAVLYTLLTGRPPFSANTIAELLHKICYTLPERTTLIVPEIPQEFDDWISSLLHKNPARRPVSATSLLNDLDMLRARLERKGHVLSIPADPGTATHEPLPGHTSDPQEKSDTDEAMPGGWSRRLRWVVLLILFSASLAALGYAFLRPRPSPESLIAAARPLLDSEDPRLWEQAWQDYLEPLSRIYPNEYTDEVTAVRVRLQAYRELRRTVEHLADRKPLSEGQRLYLRGLRLLQTGDLPAARRTWEAFVRAYADTASEQHWLSLARFALHELQDVSTASDGMDYRALQDVLRHVYRLQQAGHTAEALEILTALEELYRYHPEAETLIRAAGPMKK